MLDQMAQQLLNNGVSGVAILALSIAVVRLAWAYVMARDRTEERLLAHEAEAKKMTREVIHALHAGALAIDRITIALERGKPLGKSERS